LRFDRSVMPYPGFGMRSTSVVLGCCRATDTGMNRPLPELRPRKLVLLVRRHVNYET
jgi:hypothetical protein